jgi:hypothetical protein
MRDETDFNPDLIVRAAPDPLGMGTDWANRLDRGSPRAGGPRATSSVLAYIWVSNGVNDEKDG